MTECKFIINDVIMRPDEKSFMPVLNIIMTGKVPLENISSTMHPEKTGENLDEYYKIIGKSFLDAVNEFKKRIETEKRIKEND